MQKPSSSSPLFGLFMAAALLPACGPATPRTDTRNTVITNSINPTTETQEELFPEPISRFTYIETINGFQVRGEVIEYSEEKPLLEALAGICNLTFHHLKTKKSYSVLSQPYYDPAQYIYKIEYLGKNDIGGQEVEVYGPLPYYDFHYQEPNGYPEYYPFLFDDVDFDAKKELLILRPSAVSPGKFDRCYYEVFKFIGDSLVKLTYPPYDSFFFYVPAFNYAEIDKKKRTITVGYRRKGTIRYYFKDSPNPDLFNYPYKMDTTIQDPWPEL